MSRGSVGRVYHLVGEKLLGLREMFEMLAGAGLPTRPVELGRWQELVRERALATGNPILSTAALFEIEGYEEGDPPLQATAWQPWLRRGGIDPGVTGELLYQGLRQLARGNELFGSLLGDLVDGTAVVGAGEGR
jgi:hypothetical protein